MSSLRLVWWHEKLFIPLQVFTYNCGNNIYEICDEINNKGFQKKKF